MLGAPLSCCAGCSAQEDKEKFPKLREMRPIIQFRWLLPAESQAEAKSMTDKALARSVGTAADLADIAVSSGGPKKKQKTGASSSSKDVDDDDVVGMGGSVWNQ